MASDPKHPLDPLERLGIPTPLTPARPPGRALCTVLVTTPLAGQPSHIEFLLIDNEVKLFQFLLRAYR